MLLPTRVRTSVEWMAVLESSHVTGCHIWRVIRKRCFDKSHANGSTCKRLQRRNHILAFLYSCMALL